MFTYIKLLNEVIRKEAKSSLVEPEVEEVDLSSLVNDEISLAFKGKIVLWSGSIASIPAGWQLCDGTNGTPMLIDSFVIGAGSGYAVNFVGGDLAHDHPVSSPPHNHSVVAGTGVNAGNDFNPAVSSETTLAVTDLVSNLPPCYALCYIMKL